jgi:hypothetical protein
LLSLFPPLSLVKAGSDHAHARATASPSHTAWTRRRVSHSLHRHHSRCACVLCRVLSLWLVVCAV